MNLVVGATGVLGTEICSQLARAGKSVRALVRKSSSPERVEALRKLGAELVTGDLTDRASLDSACRGVHTVFSTATAILSQQEGNTLDRVDREGQANLVDAAAAAGVKRFVFISFRMDRDDVDFPLRAAKRATAERLRSSGIPWTVIEASIFMEVWLGPHLGFDAANARARVLGSGDQKISWVSLYDVAALAIAAAESPDAENRTIPGGRAGGPLPPRGHPHLRRKVGAEVRGRAGAGARDRADESQCDEPDRRDLRWLEALLCPWHEIDMREILRRFPRRLTTVREYADRVLAG